MVEIWTLMWNMDKINPPKRIKNEFNLHWAKTTCDSTLVFVWVQCRALQACVYLLMSISVHQYLRIWLLACWWFGFCVCLWRSLAKGTGWLWWCYIWIQLARTALWIYSVADMDSSRCSSQVVFPLPEVCPSPLGSEWRKGPRGSTRTSAFLPIFLRLRRQCSNCAGAPGARDPETWLFTMPFAFV